MMQSTSGPMKWWWRVSLICLLNAVGITVLTEFTWYASRGDPVMWRRIWPGPTLFQFRGAGIILGLLTVGLPTAAGLMTNQWLIERRFRRSLSATLGRAWRFLAFWRYAWLNRSALAVIVVLVVGVASSIFWVDEPIARLIGRTLATSVSAKTPTPSTPPPSPFGFGSTLGSSGYVYQSGNPTPSGLVIPAFPKSSSSLVVPAALSAAPTISVATWIQRTHEVLLLTVGAILAMGVFRVLCLRGTPADGMLHCLRCDYILKGLTEPRCPECGEPI